MRVIWWKKWVSSKRQSESSGRRKPLKLYDYRLTYRVEWENLKSRKTCSAAYQWQIRNSLHLIKEMKWQILWNWSEPRDLFGTNCYKFLFAASCSSHGMDYFLLNCSVYIHGHGNLQFLLSRYMQKFQWFGFVSIYRQPAPKYTRKKFYFFDQKFFKVDNSGSGIESTVKKFLLST